MTFLDRYHYTIDGACHLSPIIVIPVVSDNPYNSDTEQLNDEDRYMDSVEVDKTRRELHWFKYLERLRSTALGTTLQIKDYLICFMLIFALYQQL